MADGGVAAKVDDGVVVAKAAGGGVAATMVAGSNYLQAIVVEHVVGAMRTPNNDATWTTRFEALHHRRGAASQLELSCDPMADVGSERQFTIIVKVDTHIRKTNLSVVYTNDPVVVGSSINTLEQLLAEDDNYKVVGFNLDYTGGRAGHDEIVAVAQLFMHHHVLVY
ncbi:hypothetical protein D1007_25854 [Hordeum vulgare]|nr:hypothetical protein D1007_25854 [Hordeum vulgare]